MLTYKNSRQDLSIQYPSNWTIIKKNPVDRNIIATFRLPFEDNPKLFHADFRIVVEDSKKTNLAGLVMTRLGILSNIICLNFKLLESKPSNLTGFYPAHQLIFSCKLPQYNNMDFKIMEKLMVKNKKAYTLDYIAETTTGVDYYDRYLPVAQKMINSFELTKSKD